MAVAWAASFLHAIFATVTSAVMYSSIPEKYPEDLSRWGEQILESKLIYFVAAVFNSYFATDAVHYWRSETLSIKEVAVHHTIFLTVGAVNFISPLFPGSFAVLYGGEFSTIFLAMRWFLKAKAHGADVSSQIADSDGKTEASKSKVFEVNKDVSG